ncbi:MAG: TolC family protein [Betaproteobacteria bacterium]
MAGGRLARGCAVGAALACYGLHAPAAEPGRPSAAVAPAPLDRPWSAPAEPLRGALPLSEAVRRALQRNATIHIQAQQVRIGEGAVQQARGAYDPEVVARAERDRTRRPLARNESADLAARGVDATEEVGGSTQYRVGVEQTLESGMRYDAGFTVGSTSTNTNLAGGIAQQTTGNLRFGLRVPLQRNALGVQLAGNLRSTEYEREAAVEDLLQTSAAVVLATVQAYWELASRLGRLEILRASEQRAAELVGELNKLIAVDQVPAAEVHLAVASEVETRAARAAEEQQVQQVWNILARLLNADAGEAFASAVATEALPELSEETLRAAVAATANIDAALERRPDLRSARLRERAAHELVLVSANGLKPQLDLLLGASTAGLAEGGSALALAPALSERRSDPAFSVALELRWPWRNDSARGQLLSRSAAHDQATLRMRELERSIGPAIVTTAYSLRRTVDRYRQTEAAIERYAVSVQNERTKRRLGLSTLIDVINVQDRLDGAQLALLQLRQEYAQLVAQLHFEVGALVRRTGEVYEVDIESLLAPAPRIPRR